MSKSDSGRAIKMLDFKMPINDMEPLWRLGKKTDFYGFLIVPFWPRGTLFDLLLRAKNKPDLLNVQTRMYLCADLISAVLEFNQFYQMIDCNICLDHFVLKDSLRIAFSNLS